MRKTRYRPVKATAEIKKLAGNRKPVFTAVAGSDLKPARTNKAKAFWWLESGRESCSACGHTYVYETGYHCDACDGGLCSICIEETVSIIFCAQCKLPKG